MYALENFNESIVTGNAQQILEHPQNQTVPVNSVARFTCTTTNFVLWQIDETQLSSDSAEDFKELGFTVDSENESVLLVNATQKNNGTKILCRTGLSRAMTDVTSEVAVLTVFGEYKQSVVSAKLYLSSHCLKQPVQFLHLTSHWSHLLFHGSLHSLFLEWPSGTLLMSPT